MMIDAVVIGKGLIGTAVTRYLSQAGLVTAVIGPDEPPSIQNHKGVFASHYDQGRITRQLSKDQIWSTLASQAIAQYDYLQTQSGIQFYKPVSGLYVSQPNKDGDYLTTMEAIANRANIHYQNLTAPNFQIRFPFFQFPESFQIIHEPAPAGYINPRDLIRAQLTIAEQQGSTIFRQTVHDIQKNADFFTITTNQTRHIQAKNIVICAGAFTNCHNLLPKKLDLKVKTETIILAEISKEEARRLENMPTVIYQIDSAEINDIYLLPPIQYPDGRIYLKMGCNTFADSYLSDLAEMQAWMIAGNSNIIKEVMKQALLDMLPGLTAVSFQTKRCLVTYTPHGKPFVDQLDEGVFVATGGNGSSAKSSDAIGKLAADLLIYDGWRSELDKDSFRAVFV